MLFYKGKNRAIETNRSLLSFFVFRVKGRAKMARPDVLRKKVVIFHATGVNLPYFTEGLLRKNDLNGFEK